MFKSRYSESEKQDIVNDRVVGSLSVREVCEKYDITVQTFYAWQRKLNNRLEDPSGNSIPEIIGQSPDMENIILRRLYINLSAHNYELAKFLEK